MYRNYRNNRGGFPIRIIRLIILFSFFIPFIFDILDIALSFFVPFFIILAGIFIVIALFTAIFNNKNTNKKVDLSIDDFLKSLTTIEGNKIAINDEISLIITNKDEINLNNIDIFIREEYIGTLEEYQNSFPYAFNILGSKLLKQLGGKKKKKSKKKVKDEAIEILQENQVVEKDCTYYINKFNELNFEIENQQVKNSISETISYLKDVKQIEDKFGESKDKTRKLYQYYLPMYVDILANYDRLYDNAPSSQEFKDCEQKLLKTSSLINSAMKSLSSTLMESYYTDLNVNMKTLQSVLKKDGLVSDIQEGDRN